MNKKTEEKLSLIRGLGFFGAIGLVSGTMIGTGVFLKSAIMAHDLKSIFYVISAWVVAGLLSLAGALSYAELGARYPRAGGEFAYLKEIYGDLSGFFYGWMRFWIGSPASIAAYAIGAATFFASGLGVTESGTFIKTWAIISIIVFSGINCLTVIVSGRLQVVLTALKILMVLGLALAMFLVGGSSVDLSATFARGEFTGLSAFAAALWAALWAYDGWNNMPMVSSEIKDPQKNVPRALIWGTLIVMAVYVLINIGYFMVLPLEEVINSSSKYNPEALPVAAKAAASFFGENSGKIFSFLFVVSALGAMNGSILTSARVPYAMSEAKVFPNIFEKLSHTTRVPVMSVIIQALISIAFAFTNSFDQLTDYVVFSAWIFYTMCTFGVIVERRKKKPIANLYQVPFYPWTPVLFILTSVWLLVSSVISLPRESVIGVLIIGSGYPFYMYFKKARTINQ